MDADVVLAIRAGLAFEKDVADEERDRRFAGDKPAPHLGELGGRAVGVLEIVDGDADFVLARLEDERRHDARGEGLGAGVEEVELDLEFLRRLC